MSAHAVVERIGSGAVGTPDDAVVSNAGLLVVATRHASHAELAERGLRAGKAVFVEKPPCLTWEELEDLRSARAEGGGLLVVGFNRRHAPLAARMSQHLAGTGRPMEILIRVAAGRLPNDSWILDPADGGGRLLGEGCHFVDLACWIADAIPVQVTCTTRPPADGPIAAAQRFAITLDFADGSVATILYTSEGAAGVPKEHVEVHAGGKSVTIEDFRHLITWDGRRRKRSGGRSQDKGHKAQFVVLSKLLSNTVQIEALDPLDTMAVTLAALDAAQLGSSRSPHLPAGR